MSASPESQPYPLAVRDSTLASAFGLLLQSLPYALARFGILLAASFVRVFWIVITFGGAAWLGAHIAQAFGWVWFIGCASAALDLVDALRYALYLIECGHVAVPN
jgi:hypothetical protein